MDKLFWRSTLLLLRFYPIPSPRQKLRAPCATVYAEGAGNRTAQRDIAKPLSYVLLIMTLIVGLIQLYTNNKHEKEEIA